MALMLSKLNDALLAGGTPADKAQAASEEVAAYENRIAMVDTRLAVLTWMAGANLALTIGILFKLFR
jgi:hypothetical protein